MSLYNFLVNRCIHDDVIKWRHFLRYRPFMWGIHWSPVNSPHKGQWRGALMFSLISAWINGWVNNRETGDMRRHRAHSDVIVMTLWIMRAGAPLALRLQWVYNPWVVVAVAPCWVNSMGLNEPLTSDFLHLFFTIMLTHFRSSKSS